MLVRSIVALDVPGVHLDSKHARNFLSVGYDSSCRDSSIRLHERYRVAAGSEAGIAAANNVIKTEGRLLFSL